MFKAVGSNVRSNGGKIEQHLLFAVTLDRKVAQCLQRVVAPPYRDTERKP
jgi:hypothetical protein